MRLALAVLLSAAAASTATYLFCPRTSPGAVATDTAQTKEQPPALAEAPPPAVGPALRATDQTSSQVEQLRGELAEVRRRLDLAQAESARLRGFIVAPSGNSDALDKAGVADLVEVSARVSRRARELLLVPPESVQARHATLLAREGSGVGRILPRGKYEQLLEVRGGGAYYSFATRDNSYDKEPDIELQQGNYSSGFYGGTWGCVLDLGTITVESVPDSPALLPPGFGEDLRPKWEVLWQDAETSKQGYSEDFRRAASKAGLVDRPVPAVVGHTYVVRAILPGEHDHLVAFSPVEQDQFGHTLVWRVLKTWTVERRR